MVLYLAVCSVSPFPEVAESVQEELDAYRAQEDEVKRLKSIMVRHKPANSVDLKLKLTSVSFN